MSSNNIGIPEVMTQLPAFYWLPKMHKTPTGSRFIAVSSSCTTKPSSQLLTNCLNLIIRNIMKVYLRTPGPTVSGLLITLHKYSTN